MESVESFQKSVCLFDYFVILLILELFIVFFVDVALIVGYFLVNEAGKMLKLCGIKKQIDKERQNNRIIDDLNN